MPMIDAYLPKDALSAEAERALIGRVTELIVAHEMRRVTELQTDREIAEGSLKRATRMAWVWVHHDCDVYASGMRREEPLYKFIVYVPEGQADDVFRIAVARDLMQAISDAEGGLWPNPETRVWIFMWEVPEGTWGARGKPFGLNDMMAVVAPELPDYAATRLAEHRRDRAGAILESAGPQVRQ